MHSLRVLLAPSTARMRLTLVYSALFLVSGAALLTITNVLVREATQTSLYERESNGVVVAGPNGSPELIRPPANLPPAVQTQVEQIETQAIRQRDSDLQQLLVGSGVALAIMTVGSIAFGWIVAGRVLSPVRTIATTARRISASNLHERLALKGPDDEFKELGETLDGLLARLEASFESQRNFVANASHELRTPLTVQRTLVQVALADPAVSTATLRSTCQEILACSEQQERILEALLTLASSEQGLDRREQFDLAEMTAEVIRAARPEFERRSLHIGTSIDPAPIVGDPRLIQRLVANLFDNAVRHNVQGGWVEVATSSRAAMTLLSIENCGPKVLSDDVDRLLQPFQRQIGARASHQNGHGFGLSIVRAIAAAHGADLVVRVRPEGGLALELKFPLPAVGAELTQIAQGQDRAPR